MIPNARIKQHDTKIRFTHEPEIDGVPVPYADVVNCELKFMLSNSSKSIRQTAIIEPNGVSGCIFIYDPEPDDVNTYGRFRLEWEVKDADGKLLTFPNNGYYVVEILADLG